MSAHCTHILLLTYNYFTLLLFKLSNKEYITGTTINVRSVAIVNPLITVAAIGCSISAPSPIPIANGIKAKIVVSAVINIGLSLTGPASNIASCVVFPSSFNLLI